MDPGQQILLDAPIGGTVYIDILPDGVHSAFRAGVTVIRRTQRWGFMYIVMTDQWRREIEVGFAVNWLGWLRLWLSNLWNRLSPSSNPH